VCSPWTTRPASSNAVYRGEADDELELLAGYLASLQGVVEKRG